MCSSDLENELRRMLLTALTHNGPIALRYPRGTATGAPLEEPIAPIPIGAAEILENGEDLLILAIGRSVQDAREARRLLAGEGIHACLVNCRFVKPLDIELISTLVRRIPRVVTVEENVRQGGFGSAVLEGLNDVGIQGFRMERVGIGDTFIEHGPQKLLREKYGIDAAGIVFAARRVCSDRPAEPAG
mgnify:CR=1 FL=1